MSEERWVQHRSMDGDKWKVIEELGLQWVVEQGRAIRHSVLPKVEYVPCDPPDEWEDITEKCEVYQDIPYSVVFINQRGMNIFACEKYCRVTKVDGMHNGPAFIIERKKT